MANLLNEMTDKAKEQLNRLNQTRQQLRVLREELITTIEELNKRKPALRQALNEIVQLKDKITKLEETIVEKDKKIKDLEAEKTALQDKIAELEQKITKLEDTIKEKDDDIFLLKKRIKELIDATKGAPQPGGIVVGLKVEPGDKGKIISVNKEWNFVVLQVSDQFLQEITNPQDGSFARGVNLMVKRSDGKDTFVTKVSVMQIKRAEKLAIANILSDWQQLPVQKGDIVFY
jgi:uncharacterized phage infection (PIP) family protein YhgE